MVPHGISVAVFRPDLQAVNPRTTQSGPPTASGGSRTQPGGGGVSRGPKGRVGRVREGCPLPLVGVRGASPEKILKK